MELSSLNHKLQGIVELSGNRPAWKVERVLDANIDELLETDNLPQSVR